MQVRCSRSDIILWYPAGTGREDRGTDDGSGDTERSHWMEQSQRNGLEERWKMAEPAGNR